jgi:hypothetical protein
VPRDESAAADDGSLADRSSPPEEEEDLDLLATASCLLGRVEDCLRALQRAEQVHTEAGINP